MKSLLLLLICQITIDLQSGGIIELPAGVHALSEPIVSDGYYEGTSERLRGVTIRGQSAGVTTLQGGLAIRIANVEDLTIEGITFDFAGARNGSFTTIIAVNNCDRVTVRDCSFIDSQPELATHTIGTGDGMQTSFLFRHSEFVDRALMPGTISVSAGDDCLTDADSYEGLLSGPGSGQVLYGDNNGQWAVLATFSTPPVGPVTLTAGVCDQRQAMAIIDCDEVRIENNNLRGCGRIKVGRPGRHCWINDNFIFGCNDNAITVVEIADQGPTSDIAIRRNTILHAATVGIFAGTDGSNEFVGDQASHRLSIEGNNVTTCRTAMRYLGPSNASGLQVVNNRFLLSTIQHNGSRVYFSDRPQRAVVDLSGVRDAVITGNTIDSGLGGAIGATVWERVVCTGNLIGDGPLGWRIHAGAVADSLVTGNIVRSDIGVQVTTSGAIVRSVFDNLMVKDTAAKFSGLGTTSNVHIRGE